MSKYIPVGGDYVRVVLEGEVDFHYGEDTFDIGNNTVTVSASHVKSVEKIDAPVKVGDVLRGMTIEARNWPAGTLIASVDMNLQFILFRTEGGTWLKPDGHAYFGLGDDYKILHLPEGTDD